MASRRARPLRVGRFDGCVYRCHRWRRQHRQKTPALNPIPSPMISTSAWESPAEVCTTVAAWVAMAAELEAIAVAAAAPWPTSFFTRLLASPPIAAVRSPPSSSASLSQALGGVGCGGGGAPVAEVPPSRSTASTPHRWIVEPWNCETPPSMRAAPLGAPALSRALSAVSSGDCS
jgi:hypothetical protein